jgi:glycine oxidase
VRGGLHIGAHGFVAVPAFVDALRESASRAGARIESPVEAVNVSSSPTGVSVRAGGMVFGGDRAVVAAGSWSGRVRVEHLPPVPVRPVRGQLLHLEWRDEPRPSRVVWTSGCYTVPWRDGTLLVGATVEDVGFDERTTDAGIRDLTAAVTRVLPGARRARLADVRAGLRPASADGLPYIGPIDAPSNIALATGHYRNGILLAPLTAAMIATWALAGRRDPMMSWTAPSRMDRPEESQA